MSDQNNSNLRHGGRGQLELHLIPGSEVKRCSFHYHTEAYRMWRRVGLETCEGQAPGPKLESNEYTTANSVVGLFDRGRCKGMSPVRFLDLRLDSAQEDQVFLRSGGRVLSEFKRLKLHRIHVSAGIFVAPEAQAFMSPSMNLSDWVMASLMCQLIEKKAHALLIQLKVGSVDSLRHKWAPVHLHSNWYAVYGESLTQMNVVERKFIHELWEHRIDHTGEGTPTVRVGSAG